MLLADMRLLIGRSVFCLSSVPAMYPQNIYSQLCTVDALERTGISQKFAREIRDILDTTYRWQQLIRHFALPSKQDISSANNFYAFCTNSFYLDFYFVCRSWLHNEEEVMLDIPTCAMAFRLLRTHGYDITSGTEI